MPAAPALSVMPGGVGTSPPGEWDSSSLAFAIPRGPRTALPSTPPRHPALSRHAVVPSRFPLRVRRAAQTSPPPEPLPPAGAIQRRVRRRTLSMHWAPAIPWKREHFPLADSCDFGPCSDYRTPVHLWFLASVCVLSTGAPDAPCPGGVGWGLPVFPG